MNTREMGRKGEDLTAYYLEKRGYKILCRNYTAKGGEIDIIAEKDGIIAFVEVKLRDDNALDAGTAAVTSGKRRRIIITSQKYLHLTNSQCQPRFDIAEVITRDGTPVKLRYYDDAFSADGIDIVY